MRKVRIVSAMLVIILGVTGCGRISKLTDKKSEQEKVRVIQNEKPEKNEQTEAPEPEEKEKKLLVAIDPGHQARDVDMSAKEPNAPGSAEMKAKASTGTSGKYTWHPGVRALSGCVITASRCVARSGL